MAEPGRGHDLQETNDPGLVNPITQLTTTPDQFTIFRPLSPQHHNNNVVINVPQSVSINFHLKPAIKPVSVTNDLLEVNSPNSRLQWEVKENQTTSGDFCLPRVYLEIRNADNEILIV